MDSLISSILLAYFRSSIPLTDHGAAPYTEIYIPILNLPAAEIRVRPEFATALSLVDLKPSDLITLDDLPEPKYLKKTLPPENTQWILVDHNALQGTLGSIYGSQVYGVVDHHTEEHKVPTDTFPHPRIIEKSASCTSLVIQYCHSIWDELDVASLNVEGGHIRDPVQIQKLDAQVARFALASILIDSVNLKATHKVTQTDIEEVQYLEAKILAAGESFDRDKYFETLNSAKSNLDSLSLDEILRKDYKQWQEDDRNVSLGISSVVKPVAYLIKKAEQGSHHPGQNEFLRTLRIFVEERYLSIFGIMTAFADDQGFHRELFIWAVDKSCVGIVTRFESAGRDELKLVDHPTMSALYVKNEDGEWMKLWQQEDLSKSRKRVAPMLRDLIKE